MSLLGDLRSGRMSAEVRAVGICVVFIAMSTWCTLYNKHVLEYVFRSSNCLLLVQNVVAAVAILCLRAAGKVDVDVRLNRADLLTGACYSLNVMCGLWSMVFVNIAMFGCLKRCTVVTSWFIELLFARTETTWHAVAPIAVMTIGTVIASYNDMMFHAFGYSLAIASCVCQSAAFELGRRVAKRKQGVAQVLYANSMVAIVLQLFMIFATGEVQALAPEHLTPEVLVHFAVNSVSCLLMNYTIFLNCSVNSPLAHAVTGNIKAAFTTSVGVLLFAAPLTVLGWCGVIGNFYGAAWFTSVKYKAARQREKDEREAPLDEAEAQAAKVPVENPQPPQSSTVAHRHVQV